MNGHVNPALYRWSLITACLTFPLIWLGGLVTTHDAGMAVPDWPGTYGYNLFLYPWTTWLFGPFDLLVEHGHRLLASVVGVLAIIMVVVAHKTEKRAWVRRLAWLFLLAVISQGVLGGVRVLLDERVVAMIHGIVGPAVFAIASFLVMINSKSWAKADQAALDNPIRGRLLPRFAWTLLILTYFQLVIGAQIRHALPNWRPTLFLSFVHTHLLFATLITMFILIIAAIVLLTKYRKTTDFTAPTLSLLGCVLIQVMLGLGTWVATFALPWQEWNKFFATYTIAGRGFAESMIVNGHQATGSLLIVCSLWLLCRVERRYAASRFADASERNDRLPSGDANSRERTSSGT